MKATPEADRLAAMTDAELIEDAARQVPARESQLHLAIGLMGSALVAVFLSLALFYDLRKAKQTR
jgi:hypothetical protein